MIRNDENVARAIFSPRMIYNGELQAEAFRLRESISEEYYSVMRMAIESWLTDILLIPERKNRQLYGYAKMNTGDIRNAAFSNVVFDVKTCDTDNLKSHAGIYVTVNGEPLKGGVKLKSISNDNAQDFLLLTIQRRLTDIARKGLTKIEK